MKKQQLLQGVESICQSKPEGAILGEHQEDEELLWSILGLLLFILYANDLPQVTRNSSVTQYADDITMMVVAKDEDLSRVRKWADINKPSINTWKKTQLLLMGRKRREQELSTVKVEMDGEEIGRNRSVKCLEVMLDDALPWRDQVESVRRKCFTGLAKLRR